MEQALLFTIRFYEGRYHGTVGYHSGSEWPPSPARLFQALLAGAARGSKIEADTQNALDWLETLHPPMIIAPHGVLGQFYANYVPNNDLDSKFGKSGIFDLDDAVAATRSKKYMRPTLFDAELPLLYLWPFNDKNTHASTLCNVAKHLYQLGRGIDMAYAEAEIINTAAAKDVHLHHGQIVYEPTGDTNSGQFLLCPIPGMRKSLTNRFESMKNLFRRGQSNRNSIQVIVQPPKPRSKKIPYNAQPHSFVFELTTRDKRGRLAYTPLTEAAQLVAEIRDKAANCLSSVAPDLAPDVERYLVGRGATEVDKIGRVHIVPIPSIGHKHADMAIRRIAVYVPQPCPLAEQDIAWAFSQVTWTDPDGIVIKEMQQIDDRSMVERFERTGRYWQSITPLALTRTRKRQAQRGTRISKTPGGAERTAAETRAVVEIRNALRHSGIKTSAIRVRAQREPFHRRGAHSGLFSANTRFSKDMLWHVQILFSSPISGPILLGDGRYLGLGLMQLTDSESRLIGFSIDRGLLDGADPAVIARSARRALLARFQRLLGSPTEKLPLYVSGHNANGSPASSGQHRHIAIAVDLPRQRILYIPPTLLQRSSTGVAWKSIEHDHRQAEMALEGMNFLLAGSAGKLILEPSFVDTDNDPLFNLAHTWESVTDYAITRHRRNIDDAEALKEDITTELTRCGWPQPTSSSVEVLSIRRGKRGGLTGRLRVSFPTAQCGPLIIGRTAHKGGGLFVGIKQKEQ